MPTSVGITGTEIEQDGVLWFEFVILDGFVTETVAEPDVSPVGAITVSWFALTTVVAEAGGRVLPV
jgi:hypothetical protein